MAAKKTGTKGTKGTKKRTAKAKTYNTQDFREQCLTIAQNIHDGMLNAKEANAMSKYFGFVLKSKETESRIAYLAARGVKIDPIEL